MKTELSRRTIDMAVAIRRQTLEEQQRFNAALELLLADLIRQEIARRKELLYGENKSIKR